MRYIIPGAYQAKRGEEGGGVTVSLNFHMHVISIGQNVMFVILKVFHYNYRHSDMLRSKALKSSWTQKMKNRQEKKMLQLHAKMVKDAKFADKAVSHTKMLPQ